MKNNENNVLNETGSLYNKNNIFLKAQEEERENKLRLDNENYKYDNPPPKYFNPFSTKVIDKKNN